MAEVIPGGDPAGSEGDPGTKEPAKKPDTDTQLAELRAELDTAKSRLGKANAEAKERREALEKLKPFADLGVSADDLKGLIKDRKDREEKRKRDEGEWETLKTELTKAHERDRTELQDALTAERRDNDNAYRDTELTAAAVEAKAYPKLLLTVASGLVHITRDDDGKRQVKVVNTAGEPLFNDEGTPMTIRELVPWMKKQEEFWPLFEGQGMAGGGAPAGSGAGGAPGKKIETMTEEERMDLIDEIGAEEYNVRLQKELETAAA